MKASTLILLTLLIGDLANSHQTLDRLDQLSEEELISRPFFCMGLIHRVIEDYWKSNKSYPVEIIKLKENVSNTVLERCFNKYQYHVLYKHIDMHKYSLQYFGDDGQFNTHDDYYFYPRNDYDDSYKTQVDLERLSKDKRYRINYCSGYVQGAIEWYWKIFGRYPDGLHLVNHPNMDSIYTNCIPKKDIRYEFRDSQTYFLQLPGYDEKLNTDDDIHLAPRYAK